ncbi:uncharacterized protein Z520_09823 [Fonsecaea multimorphosa CBS 102226]|uniref:Major facilitator superfamily (MFS) profile domain-containing protein n=1 Tax=Fonsecaea multimorphosa CBS 102226 TaxID=1442371 RepID=A0A0D2JMB4_9EURO|nr:uncharacterized protein Z520_09823 [Fonsecaea multimorphosa CBS 102226]KIX94437.1 hypothetical protein Z520_09823 [Fonsecaea multimorphosa CBS 102226]OAL20018.1 hypothetical protein AYO22_09168 [Fonsecaea multimorphosa]
MPKSESAVIRGEEIDYEDHLARLANHEDRSHSRLQAIRKNPWAFAWCLYAVWTILVVAVEDQASYNVLSIPQFRKDFGSSFAGNYVLAASWQSAFSGAPIATRVIGALATGQIADYIGRRNTLILALALSLASVTMEFVATSKALFLTGKLLNGLAVASIESKAQIAPLALRGLSTVLMAFSAGAGSLTVALIINGTGSYTSRWAYRAVFCSQFGFAGIAAAFVWFMPESPWWLLSKGQEDKALKSLRRLGYSKSDGEDAKRLASIRVTLEEIRSETEGVTYFELFRKSNLRRTIVAIAPLSVEIFVGAIFTGLYSTYYAQLAGYSTDMSFRLLVTQQVLAMVGSVMACYLVERVGRRNLTVYGTLALTILLWIMGGLAVGGSRNELRGAIAMVQLYSWLYSLTIGSTAYTFLTEVATARLRVKTMAVGLATQSCFGLIWSFVLPYLFNPDEANLGGKVGFIFGGFSIPCFVLLWWYQPETARRSYEELDEMFVKKIPARHFKTYKTEVEMKAEALSRREEEAPPKEEQQQQHVQ